MKNGKNCFARLVEGSRGERFELFGGMPRVGLKPKVDLLYEDWPHPICNY